jgi:hypothetical protein
MVELGCTIPVGEEFSEGVATVPDARVPQLRRRGHTLYPLGSSRILAAAIPGELALPPPIQHCYHVHVDVAVTIQLPHRVLFRTVALRDLPPVPISV